MGSSGSRRKPKSEAHRAQPTIPPPQPPAVAEPNAEPEISAPQTLASFPPSFTLVAAAELAPDEQISASKLEAKFHVAHPLPLVPKSMVAEVVPPSKAGDVATNA